MLNSYLGQKGYTIIKNELTHDQYKEIRDDLTIKPYTPGAPQIQNNSFLAYRESPNKLYVPHYYGVKKFGNPKEYRIPEGEPIHLSFHGSLREYQSPVVDKFISYVKSKPVSSGLLDLFCAWGKTSASLYIISQLKKKTLVIVHKEFLMNQWIERIQQFLPTARMGKIQGQMIDIENKDIVLCMLQSLSMKDYPSTLFESFGFTIIDEVHHISSQTFSCALFKIVTKYMLGLSATMNRKDGTTNVFKMFLGEVIYKAERKDEHEVEVRAITYKTNNEEFNDTILDYKGNPQISSMISKLCSYNNRTEFIINVLNDHIRVDGVDIETIEKHKEKMDRENPCCEICKKSNHYLVKNTCCNSVKYCLPCMDDITISAKINKEQTTDKKGKTKTVKKRAKCPSCSHVLSYEQNYIENSYVKPIDQVHTIVMSHNLNVLEYIYNKMVCRNYASVGYYVGGMSETELKETEKKQVILASYSMCSEGLDIPTLTTEFLISPKTDIVQIVGRILRAKHKTARPTIYDFVDSHDVFQRQWIKRKIFYKKNNYKIIGIDNYNYSLKNELLHWKSIFQPNDIIEKEEDSEESEDLEDEKHKDSFLSGKCFLRMKK